MVSPFVPLPTLSRPSPEDPRTISSLPDSARSSTTPFSPLPPFFLLPANAQDTNSKAGLGLSLGPDGLGHAPERIEEKPSACTLGPLFCGDRPTLTSSRFWLWRMWCVVALSVRPAISVADANSYVVPLSPLLVLVCSHQRPWQKWYLDRHFIRVHLIISSCRVSHPVPVTRRDPARRVSGPTPTPSRTLRPVWSYPNARNARSMKVPPVILLLLRRDILTNPREQWLARLGSKKSQRIAMRSWRTGLVRAAGFPMCYARRQSHLYFSPQMSSKQCSRTKTRPRRINPSLVFRLPRLLPNRHPFRLIPAASQAAASQHLRLHSTVPTLHYHRVINHLQSLSQGSTRPQRASFLQRIPFPRR